MASTDFKWSTGFNNAPGLVSVELDVPAFQGKPFWVRSTIPDEGIARTRGDKTIAVGGFRRFTWLVSGFSDEQYLYIQDAYTPGGTGLSAEMTVATLVGYPLGVATFANFSAVLRLPKRSELQPILNAFLDVPLVFVIEAAL